MGNEENTNVIDNLVETFGLTEGEETPFVKLRVVTVGEILSLTARKGATIGELKEENGYEDSVKITDKSGIPLRNDFVIDKDMDLYLSVPKSNG